MDESVGRILQALKSLGIENNTLVVFTSDNGPEVRPPLTSSSLKLLQQVRDEAHRFAITFHRERRSKRIITSELLSVKGIGPALTTKLLKEFGSVDAIRALGKERLAEVVGEKKADLLISHFAGNV